MEVIHPRCAGIDISKKDAKVCVRVQGRGPRSTASTVTTWGAMTGQILDLKQHLLKERVSLVVMEATSDYWRPFYYLLEDDGLNVVLVNARDARNVPGRKTDVSDAAWLADLGAHGLVRASFVPPPPIRELLSIRGFEHHPIVRFSTTDRTGEHQRSCGPAPLALQVTDYAVARAVGSPSSRLTGFLRRSSHLSGHSSHRHPRVHAARTGRCGHLPCELKADGDFGIDACDDFGVEHLGLLLQRCFVLGDVLLLVLVTENVVDHASLNGWRR